MKFTASIATQQTDEFNRQQEIKRGMQANIDGKTIYECPWVGGVVKSWWIEGWTMAESLRKQAGE